MTHTIPNRLLLLLAAGILALPACKSATESEDDHADEVDQVRLMVEGEIIATYDAEDETWTDSLVVAAGQESSLIEVQFIEHGGQEIHMDEDEAFTLEVTVANASIAAFTQTSPRAFAGKLRGIAAGSTNFTFMLMHGGHPDFIAAPVNVVVSP